MLIILLYPFFLHETINIIVLSAGNLLNLVYLGGKLIRDILDFSFFKQMASVSVVPASGLQDPSGNTTSVDRLPDEMNDMKIRDDKVNDGSSPPHHHHLLFVVIHPSLAT